MISLKFLTFEKPPVQPKPEVQIHEAVEESFQLQRPKNLKVIFKRSFDRLTRVDE
jgi:hypothetical protein